MSFGKGISRKTFDLSPNVADEAIGISFFSAVGEEGVAYFFEFCPGTKFPRHSPT